jgi:hypothetical protein
MSNGMLPDEAIPEWDVALEALLKEEQQKLGRSLRNDDFRRLTKQYAIRYDDMIATLFELCIHGEWEYHDAEGHVCPITRVAYEQLTAAGRLKEQDLKAYHGGWSPSYK